MNEARRYQSCKSKSARYADCSPLRLPDPRSCMLSLMRLRRETAPSEPLRQWFACCYWLLPTWRRLGKAEFQEVAGMPRPFAARGPAQLGVFHRCHLGRAAGTTPRPAAAQEPSSSSSGLVTSLKLSLAELRRSVMQLQAMERLPHKREHLGTHRRLINRGLDAVRYLVCHIAGSYTPGQLVTKERPSRPSTLRSLRLHPSASPNSAGFMAIGSF